MKKNLLYIAFIFNIGLAQAQLPDNFPAPNFEVLDVYGEPHELYAYLENDFTVVIYFMATWSNPCWDYHNGAMNGEGGQSALEILHEIYGVDNGGNVIVLMVEGDPNTNSECLIGGPGCNYTTYGDWSQDTPFPVIESSEVANQFEISSYPTVVTICPNGFGSESGTLTADEHWSFIDGYICPELLENDAALQYANGSAYSCVTDEIIIDLVNVGSNALTSAHITSIGGSPQVDLDWSGNLLTFQSEPINFGLITPNQGEDLIIVIDSEIESSENDSIQAGFLSIESSTHIHLELQSDTYPEDFSFFIFDENDNLVASDGDWGDLGADALILRDYYLPGNGCYKLRLEDSFGDGLFEGAYCLAYGIDVAGNNMELILDVPPGEFSEVVGGANVDQISTGTIDLDASFPTIKIFPNPTADYVNIEFELANPGSTKMELISPRGDRVFSKTLGKLGTGTHNFKIDLSEVAAGFYLLSIVCEGDMMSTRVKVR